MARYRANPNPVCRERAVPPNGAQQTVSGAPGCRKEQRIAAKTLYFEKTAKCIGDCMGQRPRRILEATGIEPPIGTLVLERPSHVSKRRLGISASLLETFCLDKSPGYVLLVCFVAAARERAGEAAPATIRVLRLHQPVAGGDHRATVNIAELGYAGGETHEHLAGIECDWDDRCLIDHSTLETAARELDAHQPIQHLLSAGTQQTIAA
jgi:hypothetical protein